MIKFGISIGRTFNRTAFYDNNNNTGSNNTSTRVRKMRALPDKTYEKNYRFSIVKSKEHRVIEYCLRYLKDVIWARNDVPSYLLKLSTIGPSTPPQDRVVEDPISETVIYEAEEPVSSYTPQKNSILKSTNLRRQKTIDYECSFCIKTFLSKSTFEAHLQTKRHAWKMRRTIEHISYGRRNKGSTVSLDSCNDSRGSTGSIVSSEEGYCTDSDEYKLLFSPELQSEPHMDESDSGSNLLAENNRKISFSTEEGGCTQQKEINNNDHNGNGNFKNDKYNFIDNYTDPSIDNQSNSQILDNSNNTHNHHQEDTFCEVANSLNNFQNHRKSTKDRLKRKKMEELKGMYNDYAASRGSSDLYKTLLDSYTNFHEETMMRNITAGIKSAISAKTKKKYSISEKEALMRRDMVLTELADTEKNFVDDLGFVVNDFFPLMENDDLSDGLKKDFEKIFGNIEEIYKFHSRIFLEKIEDCLEDPTLLTETFCKFEDELSTLYSQYCKCKPYADEALHYHSEEMEGIRKKYMAGIKLSIKDYLVKPVQRLMKYQLLLTSAKKYAERSGVDTTAIQDAIDVMDRVPKLANDAMHVELINGYDGFLQSEDLLFQEVMEVSIGGNNKKVMKEMRVFVFDSVIIFSEIIPRKGRLSSYKCVAKGQTNMMGFTETVENEPRKFAIWFRKFNTTDIYVCQAENETAKEAWIQVFRDVIALQTILINRSSQHTSLEKIDASRKREGVYRRSSRVKYVNDLVVGETLRQALQGHPRFFQMSERLKNNIERYILHELIMTANENDPLKPSRSQSYVTISSLVHESDLKPSCRVRSMSANDVKKAQSQAKTRLVSSVNKVSFEQLDR